MKTLPCFYRYSFQYGGQGRGTEERWIGAYNRAEWFVPWGRGWSFLGPSPQGGAISQELQSVFFLGSRCWLVHPPPLTTVLCSERIIYGDNLYTLSAYNRGYWILKMNWPSRLWSNLSRIFFRALLTLHNRDGQFIFSIISIVCYSGKKLQNGWTINVNQTFGGFASNPWEGSKHKISQS